MMMLSAKRLWCVVEGRGRRATWPLSAVGALAALCVGAGLLCLLCAFRSARNGGGISRRPLAWDAPPLSPLGTVRPAPPFIAALVTAAFVPGRRGELQQSRDREYALGMDYFFPRFEDRVAGLIAGGPEARRWPLLARYPFARLHFFDSNFTQKSAKESHGIQHFVRDAVAAQASEAEGREGSPWTHLRDDDVVFKASGRYQIVRDDFVDEIARTHTSFDVWAKTFGSWTLDDEGQHRIERGDKKIFTFCWAMKWAHFRDLYLNVDLEKLERFDGNKGWCVVPPCAVIFRGRSAGASSTPLARAATRTHPIALSCAASPLAPQARLRH